jgi:hypothetical protein
VHTPLTATLSGKLPFAISRDEAVTLMARAIERRYDTFAFPWQMRALSRVLKFAPEALVRRLSPAARTRAPE